MSSIKDYVYRKLFGRDKFRNLYLKKEYSELVRAVGDKKNIIGRYPLNVQIQTTSACNAKCMFCPYQGSWQQKNPGQMERHVFESIILGLKGFKIKKFCPYLENEPLLDKDLFRKIKYAIEILNPGYVELSSNFSVLSDEQLSDMALIFPKISHEIWVSFHGVSQETYEEVMGLKFERTLNNVLRMVEMSQKIPLNIIIRGSGAPKKKMTKVWFNETDYRNFWQGHLSGFEKKPKVMFFPYHDRASSVQLRNKGMAFGGNVRDNLEGFYCDRFDRWIHFLYTGEPLFCCMDYNRETVFGNSIEFEKLEEMYCSEKYLDLIRKGTGLIESEKDFICKRCISPGG